MYKKSVDTHVHKTSIDIKVGIDLDGRDGQTRCLEEQPTAGGDNALANAGDDTCKGPLKKLTEKHRSESNYLQKPERTSFCRI